MSKDEKDPVNIMISEEDEHDESNEKSPLKSDKDTDQVVFTSGGDAPAVAIAINGKDGDKKDDTLVGDLKSRLTAPWSRLVILVVLVTALAVVSIMVALAFIVADDGPPGAPVSRMLTIIPAPQGAQNLISFKSGQGSEGDRWPLLVKQLNETLDSYVHDGPSNFTSCVTSRPSLDSLTCAYPMDEIRALCKSQEDYGYPQGSPCILVQINHRQLFNFTPQVFTSDDLKNIDQLDPLIRETYRSQGPYLECKGNSPVDVETAGEIEYSAAVHEYPVNYFPYLGHGEYQAPVMAIRFNKPTTGVVIGITCKLYAKNIGPYDLFDPLTNTTTRISGDESLPSAEFPFNLFIE
ncbi:Sodium/potassium-transporting ATPase subunit beta [Halotydeus destructor]|nr:Sodium/potassium-transporting ATPase subunit beta [Halotydeus destructor]